jgi:hypothetical protein
MTDAYNEFAKKFGARKEIWDEDLKFRYQNKSMREYSASVYGLPYREFPVTAFTSQAVYLQWCLQVSGVMPDKRRSEFHKYMQERLSEAEEEAIPPNTEEGAEVGVVILTILKSKLTTARNFDLPGGEEDERDKLVPGEWIFVETAEDSQCGLEVYVKYEGLRACILDQVAMGCTETKLTRKEVVKWLRDHGRYYDRKTSINRRRSAYVLPYDLVKGFEIFALRGQKIW